MGQRRVTVRDAADILGISESAVRNRLSRGTLERETIQGVTYVVLEDVTDDIPPTDAATDHRDELIAELRDRVRSLEATKSELEEANRENRRLLLLAMQGREIEAPESSGQNGHLNEEEPPVEETEGWKNHSAERRPWWRRIFGG